MHSPQRPRSKSLSWACECEPDLCTHQFNSPKGLVPKRRVKRHLQYHISVFSFQRSGFIISCWWPSKRPALWFSNYTFAIQNKNYLICESFNTWLVPVLESYLSWILPSYCRSLYNTRQIVILCARCPSLPRAHSEVSSYLSMGRCLTVKRSAHALLRYSRSIYPWIGFQARYFISWSGRNVQNQCE